MPIMRLGDKGDYGFHFAQTPRLSLFLLIRSEEVSCCAVICSTETQGPEGASGQQPVSALGSSSSPAEPSDETAALADTLNTDL